MQRRTTIAVLLILFCIPGLKAQDSAPDTTENKLIRFFRDFGRVGFRYGKGYWTNRLLHRREFYQPIQLIPLELSYGLITNAGGGKKGQNLRSDYIFYESAVEKYQGGTWTTRVGHQLELDLLKVNLSQYLFQTSWMNVHTGLNLRYTSLFSAPQVPSSWGVGSKRLSPRILEPGLSTSFILQWFDHWYLTGRYTYGRAFAKLYKTGKKMDPSPSGSGPAVSYAFGFRFILDPGLDNRFTVGVDFKHGFTKLTKINDPDNVAPISGMHISSYGLFLTLSAFYGGKPTIGEEAKAYFYHKDYITAREKFREFLAANPNHANTARAQWFLDECNRLIPEQLVKEGLSFDDRGLEDSALNKYLQARSLSSDSVLSSSLDERIRQMGAARVVKAQQMVFDGQFEEALALMLGTAQFYAPAKEQLPEFRARVTLEKGRYALQRGLYFRAVELVDQAVQSDPELRVEAELLRYEIAVKLVEEANTIHDPSALQLMINSLETAQELSGDLGKRNDAILAQLHQQLSQWEERRLRTKIDRRMENERIRILERNRRRLETGMTVPEVQDLLGNPEQVQHQQTANGQDAQLWFYTLKDGRSLQLSFLDFVLFKIEKVKASR
ncbi:MAG: hypothetical protein GXO90_09545 [FCB group bacterium]|nr:hypothetical protein [FCB group bacterium]